MLAFAGGCQLALHGDRLFLYSGHTLVVDKQDKSESDCVHDDLWSLDLNTFVVRLPSTCSNASYPVRKLLQPVSVLQELEFFAVGRPALIL